MLRSHRFIVHWALVAVCILHISPISLDEWLLDEGHRGFVGARSGRACLAMSFFVPTRYVARCAVRCSPCVLCVLSIGRCCGNLPPILMKSHFTVVHPFADSFGDSEVDR